MIVDGNLGTITIPAARLEPEADETAVHEIIVDAIEELRSAMQDVREEMPYAIRAEGVTYVLPPLTRSYHRVSDPPFLRGTLSGTPTRAPRASSGRAGAATSLVKIASFDDHLPKVRPIPPGLRSQVSRAPPRRPSASSAALGTFAASHARTAAKQRAADA